MKPALMVLAVCCGATTLAHPSAAEPGYGGKSVASLIQALDDKDPAIRFHASFTLHAAGGKADTPLLVRFCESKDPNLRRASALARGQIDAASADKATTVLIELLGEGGEMAALTAFDIGSAGPRASRAVPALE